jgi:uncharacterized protein
VSTAKPSSPEDEYFAKTEAEKLKKLAKEQQSKLSGQESEKLKAIHWMRCPKCGHELHEIPFRGVNVDKCLNCQGIFLDDGEMEAIAGGEESGFFKALGGLFKD